MIILNNKNGFIHSKSSDITPENVYLNRREILKKSGFLTAAGVLGLSSSLYSNNAFADNYDKLEKLSSIRSKVAGVLTMEVQTPFGDAASYNNFYEFSTSKSAPKDMAHVMKTKPWTIDIEGLVEKPFTLSIEELLKLSDIEERVYRLRCVEGWSMVIPWLGYSLSNLIKKAKPLGSAKYIEFVTLADKNIMQGLKYPVLDWPYTEALRLDEANAPLAMLAFGMYGRVLPNQNGAPVRLVVPWKYGFKSIKSIVKIRFLENEPKTAWTKAAINEYGFYSNVNPNVPHPRWSQAKERRIGAGGLFAGKIPTLMFNGYEEQVGQLYTGMDLRANF